MGLVILLCQIMSLDESLDLSPLDKHFLSNGVPKHHSDLYLKVFREAKKNSEFAQTVSTHKKRSFAELLL